jgi:hypothetical protein
VISVSAIGSQTVMVFSPESATKIIGAIIVPAVMISTCALLLNGVMLRYKAIDDLLRSLNQEQSKLRAPNLDNGYTNGEWLHHLEHLIPKLLRHHHVLHEVLTLIYISILIFMVDMLAIAVAESTSIQCISFFVLIVFLLGVGVLCWSISLTVYELREAHNFVQLELQTTCNSCNPKRAKIRDRRLYPTSTYHPPD